ncbi:MAG: hypothetical protein KatS3mg105_4765 [Gemmatales bacterium]|nr:MAG: hypothetical protein KatS3mg105_4765 [Gemmatales bacterium]
MTTATLSQRFHDWLARFQSHGSDAELVERFVRDRDENAFATLMARHGAMVRGVCQRLLHQAQDVEDVYQATFLVFLQRANRIRRPEAVASWLHGVARRLAWKKRRRQQTAAGEPLPESARQTTDELSVREFKETIDAEISRLPERYRNVLILCCMEGKTRDEAAHLLGWSVQSVKGRLERARQMLRCRLERKGIALAIAMFLLKESTVVAASQKTQHALRQAAHAWRNGQNLPASLSPQVIELAHSLSARSLSSVLTRLMALAMVSATLGLGAANGIADLTREDKDDKPTVLAVRSDRPVPQESAAAAVPQSAAEKPAPVVRVKMAMRQPLKRLHVAATIHRTKGQDQRLPIHVQSVRAHVVGPE